MIPFKRHMELCYVMDSMLRNGYIGRAPMTAAHIAIFQEIYEKQKRGEAFRQSANSLTPQLSTSLIGISGMGKTTTVERWVLHIPPVIYHPDYGIYQVPVLHIQIPSNGASLLALGLAILQRLDKLFPDARYYEEYAHKWKVGGDSLMSNVARVMNIHFVGLLICDEIQNLVNAPKGSQILMSELVAVSNELKVPILFIGTNKAQKILGVDFRSGRRGSGGLDNWDRFPEFDKHDSPLENSTQHNLSGEWHTFIDILWNFQWVKVPVPINDVLRNIMYQYSQGVIGVAILLFISVQARAMADGTEKITTELITSTYIRQLKLLHPMIDALRNNDLAALANFDDIAPIGIEELLNSLERQVRSRKHDSSSKMKPAQDVTESVAIALAAAGHSTEDALAVATAITEKRPSISKTAGVKAGLAQLAPMKPLKTGSKKGKAHTLLDYDFTTRPSDYRKAIKEANLNKTTVLQQLKELGMIKNLDEILKI